MSKPIHRHSLPITIERGLDMTLILDLSGADASAVVVSSASLVIKNGSNVLLTVADVESGGLATYDLDGSVSEDWPLTEDLMLVWSVTVDGSPYTYKQTGSICIWSYAPVLTATDFYVRYPGLRDSFDSDQIADMIVATSGEIERRLIGKGRRPYLILDRWALADVHLDLCLSRLLSSADTTLADDRWRVAAEAHRIAYEEGWGRLNFRYDLAETDSTVGSESAAASPPIILTSGRPGAFWGCW